ncbi:spore coat protein GerQ [Paenibacillus cellulosilyticus]|nr:spore coat protein GerQ [Paenibacillus cellulosilyticus]
MLSSEDSEEQERWRMGEAKRTIRRNEKRRRNRNRIRMMGYQRWLQSVRGNLATFYMTYPNNSQWNARSFTGVIVSTGKDHVVIQDEATGRTEMLLYRNLDYVTIDLIF